MIDKLNASFLNLTLFVLATLLTLFIVGASMAGISYLHGVRASVLMFVCLVVGMTGAGIWIPVFFQLDGALMMFPEPQFAYALSALVVRISRGKIAVSPNQR